MNKTIRTTLSIGTTNMEYPGSLSEEKIKIIEKSINEQRSTAEIARLTEEARENLLEYLKFASKKLGSESFAVVTTPSGRNELALLIKSVSQWDDNGNYDLQEYNEQKRTIKQAFLEGLEYEEEVLVRESTIQTALSTLDALDDRMSNLNRTKEWVDQDSKDDVFRRLKETR